MLENANNVIPSSLNINCLRNKIGIVEELITNNIDVCLLSENKIAQNFRNQQFNISNYKAFWRDRKKQCGIIISH